MNQKQNKQDSFLKRFFSFFNIFEYKSNDSIYEDKIGHLTKFQQMTELIQNGVSIKFNQSDEYYKQKIINFYKSQDRKQKISYFFYKFNMINCFSGAVKSAYRILFDISNIIRITLLILILYFINNQLSKLFSSKLRFCDSNIKLGNNMNCIECPSSAVCVNGSAECKQGYKLINKNCILDDEHKVYTSKLLDIATNLLSIKAGEKACKKNETDYIRYADLYYYLVSSLNGIGDDDVQIIVNKAISHLKDHKDIYYADIDEFGTFFTSKVIKKSFNCHLKSFIYKYQIVLYIITILTIFYRLHSLYHAKQRLGKHKYEFVLDYIKSQQGSCKESTLRKLLSERDRSLLSVWPIVNNMLTKNPMITKRFESDEFVFSYRY